MWNKHVLFYANSRVENALNGRTTDVDTDGVSCFSRVAHSWSRRSIQTVRVRFECVWRDIDDDDIHSRCYCILLLTSNYTTTIKVRCCRYTYDCDGCYTHVVCPAYRSHICQLMTFRILQLSSFAFLNINVFALAVATPFDE